jgi:hypothetical protein
LEDLDACYLPLSENERNKKKTEQLQHRYNTHHVKKIKIRNDEIKKCAARTTTAQHRCNTQHV